MKLLDLHISGFGKFHDCDLTFSDGLNIVYGKNEAGKSTLHTFIRSMLFGLERARGRASKNDTWSHYEPWDNKAVYGGRMRVEHNGTIYRLERTFQKDQKQFAVIDETNGREVEPTRAFLDDLLSGLTETTYANTISIGQLKSATEGGMVSELRNYIANMNTSGNMALNITRASANLQSRRKQFERQLHPDAAREYASLTAEIRSIEKEIADPKYENQLLSWQNMRTQVRDALSQKQEERETLLQRIATGRQALAGAQFTDEASIKAYQEDTCATYQEYQTCKEACEKRSLLSRIGTGLLIMISIFSAAGAAFCYTAAEANPLAATLRLPCLYLFYACLAACILTAGLAIALIHNQKHLLKEMSSNGKLLQEVFSRHLGDSTVSDEALQAFNARMDEYIRLSQTLVRSEAAINDQAAEISSLQQKASSCDNNISQQQKTQWELEKKLDHLATCKDKIEALNAELEENNRIREEIEAIDLALDTMTELSSTIRNSFGLYLNKAASDMIGEITGGVYNSMSVDENLDVFMNTPTKLVPVSQVSSGTMDQIYLALRLAAAKLLQEGREEMPMIFDDSFVLYDDERLKTALKWLATAYEGQILIFTCHQREAQMLTANQIPYHLVSM